MQCWQIARAAVLTSIASLIVTGCTTGRELVGTWTAVNAKMAPYHMARIIVINDHEMKLDDGSMATYKVSRKSQQVTITFPYGGTINYGFERSGENLTIIDIKKKIRYYLEQG